MSSFYLLAEDPLSPLVPKATSVKSSFFASSKVILNIILGLAIVSGIYLMINGDVKKGIYIVLGTGFIYTILWSVIAILYQFN